MAGTMVHLTIAELLWKRIGQEGWHYVFDTELCPQEDLFIAGNICPDGIMARKNYQRKMKLHSHFRDGIPDGSFDKPGMQPLFRRRMAEFWREHQEDERELPGLYLGYITHMMTDEKFVLEERPKFFQEISRIGLTQRDRETFVRFNEETDLVDFALIRNEPMLQKAKQSLQRVQEYEIKHMITAEELTDSRNWILQHFFVKEHPDKKPEFLSYESMMGFIRQTTEEILQRLLEEQLLIP